MSGMKTIDLRSDTVTRPTPAMREAMASAEVGDDVYGEDPTVTRLEARVAELLGKEAALFVPSGTMGNQIALRTLTHHGDAVIATQGCHILRYEAGAAAALAGLQIETVGADGRMSVAELRAAIHPAEYHFAPTTVLALENTHNTAGGRVIPLPLTRELAAAAHERGLRVHLDGARLWNAAAATGIAEAEWAAPFDTLSVCLSKGLGAPVGSLVAGDRDRMVFARRLRKMLGGGMRQAGILAAAGLHALDHHRARLAVDHANARRLAEGLSGAGLEPLARPDTNIVLFRVPDTVGFLRETRARGCLWNPMAEGVFRAVTHLDVSADDIEAAIRIAGEAMETLKRGVARA
jgi:threonine aldolase